MTGSRCYERGAALEVECYERGAALEVEWHDSERVTLGWASAEDYLAALADRTVYRTAGYYVGGDDAHVMVSHSRSDSGMFGDAMVIPRAVVIRMRSLTAS